MKIIWMHIVQVARIRETRQDRDRVFGRSATLRRPRTARARARDGPNFTLVTNKIQNAFADAAADDGRSVVVKWRGV